MFEASRCGLQNVDARIAGSYPNPTASVHQDRTRSIAGERLRIGGIVAVDGKGIGRPVPARDTGVLDGYPKIVMRILDDLEDVVARQAAPCARRVSVADQFETVVADQTILGAEPHEALRILQGRIHGALRQTLRGGQMLEYERLCIDRRQRG